LHHRLSQLSEELQPLAQQVLNQRDIILDHFQRILTQKITARRIRCHGDFHLRQVLHSGKDFIIIDFEGDPALTLNERRLKRSALRDVVEMLQSFGFAAEVALRQEIESGILRPEQIPVMHQWSQFWTRWVRAVFLRSYLEVASQGDFLPRTNQELGVLLNVYLLERSIYSLAYELKQRPEGIEIALQQVLKILQSPDFQS
jgi:maltose alpha-D-glucosyltransferase/alpha-amylase